jgi:hypothetical protein
MDFNIAPQEQQESTQGLAHRSELVFRKKTSSLIQRRQSLAGCGKAISAQQKFNGPQASRSLSPLSEESQLAGRDADDMSLSIDDRDQPTSHAAMAIGAAEKVHSAIQ